jgi:hypothetical protein
MPAFERSKTTDALVRYLAEHAKGTTITYAELGRVAEREIDGASHLLRSARMILQREHSQVWTISAPGVGVRRLTDVEIAQRFPRYWLRGARRKIVRGSSQSGVVDMRELNAEEQTRLAANRIQGELALQALARSTASRLVTVAKGSSNDLPAFNILEWAINLMPAKKIIG